MTSNKFRFGRDGDYSIRKIYECRHIKYSPAHQIHRNDNFIFNTNQFDAIFRQMTDIRIIVRTTRIALMYQIVKLIR